MDAEPPVIRPVLDLTDVSEAAKGIDPMLSGDHSIGVGVYSARNAANAYGYREQARKLQNGGVSANVSENTNTVNVTGNTFQIRDEQDISALEGRICETDYLRCSRVSSCCLCGSG